MFNDRIDSGQKLALALKEFEHKEGAIIMAIPRGGIITGCIIAEQLQLPVGLVHSMNEFQTNVERDYAEVDLESRYFADREGRFALNKSGMDGMEQLREMNRKELDFYYCELPQPELSGKTVILVDDGASTGKKMMDALQIIRKERPEELIVAIPVGPADTIKRLESFSDRLVCLERPENFYAKGLYYRDLRHVSDHEILEMLHKANLLNLMLTLQ